MRKARCMLGSGIVACLPGLIDAHLDVRTAIQEGLFIGPRITGTDYVGFPVKQGVRELGSLVEAGRTVSAPSSRASLPTSFVMLGGRDVSPR